MKVLFITSTRLGDAVLSTGLLDYIHQVYPQARVTVACGPLPSSLFEGFPNVDRIIALKKQKFSGHWIKLWTQVIGKKWDAVVDLRDSAVSRLIRAERRFIFSKHIDKTKHKCEQAAQVMGLDQVPLPRLYFTEKQKIFANELMAGEGPVIGVGPSANWIGKTWPPENFIEIIKWLRAEDGLFPNARVAVFAAPGEESQANPVLKSIPEDKRINGIAKGNPGEIAAALTLCNFYIGNDSGLMHAAAAGGVPTMGVFGPSYPHLYSPWGMKAAYAQTPETYDELTDFAGYSPQTVRHSLMTSLRVADVKTAITEFLEK